MLVLLQQVPAGARRAAGAYNALRLSPLQIRIARLHSRQSLKETDVALAKKKREGKRTIAVSQARKTRSGAKKRKKDGTQPPQTAQTTQS